MAKFTKCPKKVVFACPLLKLLKTDLLEQNWILFGFFQLSNSIYCQFILCWKLTRPFDALNSPGGARPRQGGEGRQLSTARSSFPLKLQPCTATRPSSAIPWPPVCKTCKTLQAGPASGPRKPCRVLLLGQLLLLLQGLLQTSRCWSPTILQEVMTGHSLAYCKVQNAKSYFKLDLKETELRSPCRAFATDQLMSAIDNFERIVFPV